MRRAALAAQAGMRRWSGKAVGGDAGLRVSVTRPRKGYSVSSVMVMGTPRTVVVRVQGE